MGAPKRGKIKAQIMEDVVETVAFVASKAGEMLQGLVKKQGSNSGGGSSSSSPPTSPNNYNG